MERLQITTKFSFVRHKGECYYLHHIYNRPDLTEDGVNLLPQRKIHTIQVSGPIVCAHTAEFKVDIAQSRLFLLSLDWWTLHYLYCKCNLIPKPHWVILLAYVYCYIRIRQLICFYSLPMVFAVCACFSLPLHLDKTQSKRRKTFLGEFSATQVGWILVYKLPDLLWFLFLSTSHLLI